MLLKNAYSNKPPVSVLIALSAMATALTVLALYVAGSLGFMRITTFFLSAVFVFALTTEGAFMYALLVFAVSSALGLLLIPSKIAMLPYIMLLGHYCVFKDYIDLKLKNKALAFCIKLLYCNAFTAAAIAITVYVFHFDLMAASPAGVPVGLLVLALEAAFVALELLATLTRNIYATKIRNLIVTVNRSK
ncbi:MAG: hypothetical protein Q4B99_05430 [Clostridia bacterium]|nr:hypothetical protein [Clostridia bacterium]